MTAIEIFKTIALVAGAAKRFTTPKYWQVV